MIPSERLVTRVLREELGRLHDPTYLSADDVPTLRQAVLDRLGIALRDDPQRDDQPEAFRTVARLLRRDAGHAGVAPDRR